MLGVVGAGAGVDVGTAPVVGHRRVAHSPGAIDAVPVGGQREVDAPRRQQEGKYLGGRTHRLVPVIVELALDSLVEIAGVQPFLGGFDPVHDHVAIHAEGVGVGGEGEVSLGLELLSGLLEGVPVLDLLADHGGVVGAEDVLGDVAPVDKQTGAALPGGAALHAVLVGGRRLGERVLVGQVGVRVDAQVGQRHGHVGVGGGGLVQQSFVQFLLVDAVLVGVDDPVDLGAVL